jgi:hypothetical protein
LTFSGNSGTLYELAETSVNHMPGNNSCNPNHHEHHYFDSKEINEEEEVERQLTEKITEFVKREY